MYIKEGCDVNQYIYSEAAIQQGKFFSWEIQYQLKKIGI